MKHLIMMENKVTCLKRNCLSCLSQRHLTKDCPLLHYIPDREKVIKKYDFAHPQTRDKKFVRGRKRSHNARGVKQALNEIFKINSEGFEDNDLIKYGEHFESTSSKKIIQFPPEDFSPPPENKVFESK